jgi:pimeloyl-ACP methyl ester carboxylesterase
MRRLLIGAVVALALAVGGAPAAAAAAGADPPAPAPAGAAPTMPLGPGDFAGSVGIGDGRTMYLECYGHGAPTVVLDSGLRNGAGIWAERQADTPAGPTVLPALARVTRVCAYDRPGVIESFQPFVLGRSSPVPMPRTAAGAAADQEAMLRAAHVPGPYVLVSHSTGGLIDRLFAAAHPRQVAGLVLVDALGEGIEAKLDRAQMDAWEALNNGPVEGLDHELESYRFRESFDQVRAATAAHPLGDTPLSVISHGLPFGLPAGLPGGLTDAAFERAWTYAQGRLADLTPDAVHVVAHHSSHYVMWTQPRLVIDQVERIVRLSPR